MKKVKLELPKDIGWVDHVVNLPSTVPVLKNQNFGDVLGVAELFEEGKAVCANMSLINDLELKPVNVGIAGQVLERKGNFITKFKITSVSINM